MMEVRNWGYVLYFLLGMIAMFVIPLLSFLFFTPIVGYKPSAVLSIIEVTGIYFGSIYYYDS